MTPFKHKRERVVASVDFAPHDAPAVKNKPIILRTGRGDSRLTVDEARLLHVQLAAAIRKAGAEAKS